MMLNYLSLLNIIILIIEIQFPFLDIHRRSIYTNNGRLNQSLHLRYSLLGINVCPADWTGWVRLVPISDAFTVEFVVADQPQDLLLFELHHADRTKLPVDSYKRVSYFWIASLFWRCHHHPWEYIARIDQKLYEFLIVFDGLLFEIILDFLQIFLVCKQSLLLLPKCLFFCCLSQTIEMRAHQDKEKQEQQSRTCRIRDPVDVYLNFPFCFLNCSIIADLLGLTLPIHLHIAASSLYLKSIGLAEGIARYLIFIKLIVFDIRKLVIIRVKIETLHDENGDADQEEGEEDGDEQDQL